MQLVYEESGEIRAATVISSSGSGDSESWLVASLSGKQLKLKAKEVWLRFEQPSAQIAIDAAAVVAQEIDLQLLWDCAPAEEFIFTDLAIEYFGNAVTVAQKIALAIALQGAPIYFRRKGRGRFLRAPLEQLQAGLAAIERKKTELAQQACWADELVAGIFPSGLRNQINNLLFTPDKNSLAYKAVLAACATVGETPAQLFMRCGALESPLHYHQGLFLQQHFPHGVTHASGLSIAPHALQEALANLPEAPVQAFSIDDASTTEIDDAFSVSAISGGGFRIGIHIAAPALAIHRDDAFDQIARTRMSTVYFPGDKITMLPPDFIQQFSLDAGFSRPAVSLYVEVDAEGELTAASPRSVIELVSIAANLRLEDLEKLVSAEMLEEHAGKERTLAAPFQMELGVLWRTAKIFHAQRQAQRVANGLRAEPLGPAEPGALARDFLFEITGAVGAEQIEIIPRQRGSVLDTVVAEWMIYCNSTWGRLLAEQGLPGLFRTQKGWGPLRTRMQTTPAPHEGLGLEYYAWCTSPLRRYTDLVNQWQLLAIIRHGVMAKMVAPFPPRDADLMGIAADFEACYQVYGEYQDRLEKYWCLRWLLQNNLPTAITVRHLKEGMARAEFIPLHLPIPELASHGRLTRAMIEVTAVDLLQLTASTRVKEIEALVDVATVSTATDGIPKINDETANP
ncbi:ribonuclease catalytic domain-containing protein [Polynucleobacter sp. IMCC 30228]|uniref:ribonuclease catalytic domain-containing protein n=1 Tax=Polynucleobacter sp. IMCC 30228 TaxID=2781011 RepID=UPI001F1A2C03|nr:RNB domain-containing ribonuclease [Polynucleobacter sp. IMCC 30228]MCE7526077.1 RNB domain-containing ribonuclease [Polynucleobacter sp. IMCC 30228]